MRLLPLFPDQVPKAPSFASCRASPDHYLEARSDVTAHHLYSAPAPLGADVKPRQTAARHLAYRSPDNAGLSGAGFRGSGPSRPLTTASSAIGSTLTCGKRSACRQREPSVRPPPRRKRDYAWQQHVLPGSTKLRVPHEPDWQCLTPQGFQPLMPIQRRLFRSPAKWKPPRMVRADQSVADGHPA